MAIRRVELIVILGALTAFAPLSIDMYLPAFPAIESHFATTDSALQLTLASFFAAFALGQALYGPLADRFGRKRPLYVSLTLFIAASLGCAVAPSVPALIGLRFVQGLGACAGLVVGRAVVRDVFSAREGARVYSALMLVTGLAPMLAPTLGGFLLLGLGWKSIFWTLALLGAACLLGVAVRMPETHRVEHIQPLHVGQIVRRYAGLLRHRHYVAFTAIGGVSMAGVFAYIASAPFVFMELFGVSTQTFGLLFGLNAVGLVAGAQVNARLTRRFESLHLMRAACTVQVVAGAGLVVFASTGFARPYGVFVMLFLYLTALGFVMPNALAMGMAPFRAHAGSASALYGTLQFAFAAVAAIVLSAVHAHSALPMALMILTTAVVAAAIGYWMTRGFDPDQPEPILDAARIASPTIGPLPEG